MIQIIPCVIFGLSRKVNDNPFIHSFLTVANKHVAAPSISQICYSVVSNIFWKFHGNPFNSFSMILLTNTDQENIKNNPDSNNVTSLKDWSLFLVW